MANMHSVRYQNTASDFRQVISSWNDDVESGLSPEESRARIQILKDARELLLAAAEANIISTDLYNDSEPTNPDTTYLMFDGR